MADKERVFDPALRKNGLGTRSGAASLSVITQAFIEMEAELRGIGTSDAERRAFIAAITSAINEEPKLTFDERAALRAVLQSSFDGMQRETTVSAVKCNFLGRVRV